MAISPDSIPRYLIPDFCYDEGMVCKEGITCADCEHCFQVSEAECDRVLGKLSPYGRWHEHEHEVKTNVRRALKCFGVCEVECGLVDLTNEVCEHFGEVS